jgi:hypothetical protein
LAVRKPLKWYIGMVYTGMTIAILNCDTFWQYSKLSLQSVHQEILLIISKNTVICRQSCHILYLSMERYISFEFKPTNFFARSTIERCEYERL